jgi:alcohol dehydrogenase
MTDATASSTELRPFRSYLPVRISFGDGAVAELADVLEVIGASSALVLLEEPVAAIAGVADALAACEARGITLHRQLKAPGEPTFDAAEEVAAEIRLLAPGAFVAIGGGSALDLAKAARLVAEQGGPLTRFAGGATAIEAPRLPLITIPTTSGTGSEVSGGAVMTDKAAARKVGLASPNMRAQHALVDPLLTVGLPPAPTAQTGVDALAQAIGGAIVTNGNPLSMAAGLEACRHIAASLAPAVADGSDLGARRGMSLASLLAGLAMNLSDCAADHALAQAMGGYLSLPHGLTVGVVLAETLDVSRAECAAALERVADALGAPDDGSADGSRTVAEVRRLLASISFPTATEAGLRPEHVAELTPLALEEYFMTVDPHRWTADDVRAAYVAALAVSAR